MKKTLAARLLYWPTFLLGHMISWGLFPVRINGRERVVGKGPYIFASNHLSNLDPVILGLNAGRPLNYMAKRSLFKGALGFFLNHIGAFPVTREGRDIRAIKEALRRLRSGNSLLIFPQGTRVGRGGDPSQQFQAQAGVGFLAVKSGVPVVPVFLRGSDMVLPPKSRRIRRHRVDVCFGAPMTFPSRADYERAAGDILRAIHALENTPSP